VGQDNELTDYVLNRISIQLLENGEQRNL